MKTPQICPKCDGEADTLLAETWGKPPRVYSLPFAPYICTLCGSLLLIELATSRLFELPDGALEQLERNAVLWESITSWQAKVIALPDRRPVLR